MSCQDRLSSWKQEVSTAFAHLSQAQVVGLVLWSAGIALTGSSGIDQISALLAQVLEQKERSVFQRLREWYLDAAHKRGDQRRDLEVSTCLGPLLRWIILRWGGPGATPGFGAGCQHASGSLDGALHQCADPRLCHSRGLESDRG